MSFESPSTDFFRGLDMNALGIDQAYVNITHQLEEKSVYLYKLSADCEKCPFVYHDETGEPIGSEGYNFTIVTHYPWQLRLRSSNENHSVSQFIQDPHELCTVGVNGGEYGVYDIILDETQSCTVVEALEATNSNLALLYCFLILLGLGILFQMLVFVNKKGYLDGLKSILRGFKKSLGFEVKEKPEKEDNNNETSRPPMKNRLKSLDTFRGMSIALMIFVNDGAGGYYFMEHSTWNGLFVADLAFPWFMWIMGFCIPMSVRSFTKKNTALPVILIRIVKRSIKLFLLGLFFANNGNIQLERLRIPGVLQRFAISYLVVAGTSAIIGKYMKPMDTETIRGWRSYVVDIFTHWPRWIVAFAAIFIHACIIFLLPVPNCETGYLGPGGLHDDSEHLPECIGGATGYIDKLILTNAHIYNYPTAKAVYQSSAFDPEGILGCLPSIFHVFLGYQAGQIILSYSGHRQRVTRYLIWFLGTGILALGLCGASLNDGPIPINKNLWNGGVGSHSSMRAHALLPFNYKFGDMNTHWGLLPESLWGVSLWMLVAYIMHQSNAFIIV
eukprot:TCALIF_08092-PA protein Name:"Similar to Hgsnat Heparan-alpha-glucosaminide N-acetyltransferase (Mus musculus)" AED:0.16 eAED:0.16 QI:217/0.75/0.77/1/0.62/0.55/9/0/556